MFPLSYGGVLTGGSDACVRLWDGQEPKQSYVVCGPSATDKKRFLGVGLCLYHEVCLPAISGYYSEVLDYLFLEQILQSQQ